MAKFDTVYLCEKPSVARTLASYIAKKAGRGVDDRKTYLIVGNDAFTFARGHLIELAEPEVYDSRYGKWRLDDLPMIPTRFIMVERKDAEVQLDVIRKLLASCNKVIGAGDAAREGQLIQDEILLYLNNTRPVLRLWAKGLDDTSLDRAFAAMKPNEEYRGYYDAALSRSHADWLWGMNLSRAFTLHAQEKCNADFTISTGRVQTPTLGLVVAREHEIRDFVPVDYYVPSIELATAPSFRAKWTPKQNEKGDVTDARVNKDGLLTDVRVATAIVEGVKKTPRAVVRDVKTTQEIESAPLPFSLPSLQAHVSRLYGFGASEALNLAQSLYEKKLISYPRSETDYLPESQHADAQDILSSLARAALPTPLVNALRGAKTSLKSRCFNDSKLTDHHAIIPVRLEQPGLIAQLSDEERKVYLEIVKRYILQFWPVAVFMKTVVRVECAAESFIANGKRYIDEGWRKAMSAGEIDGETKDAASAQQLPNLQKDQVLGVKSVSLDKKTTTPPKRFTEGTLITAMKNVHEFVKDPAIRARLKANAGIGTAATRAETIKSMLTRGFVVKEGEELVPTENGETVIAVLPEMVRLPDITAMWQQFMSDMEIGKAQYDDFIAKQREWVSGMVKASGKLFEGVAFKSERKTQSEMTKHACFGTIGTQGCGRPLKHVHGKYGWFFLCSNGDCRKSFRDVKGKPVERAEKPGATPPATASTPNRMAHADPLDALDPMGSDGDYVPPDLQQPRAAARTNGTGASTKYTCPKCGVGTLRLIPRNDGSKSFWGCSEYRKSGCKGAFDDANGEPDFEGKKRGGSGGRGYAGGGLGVSNGLEAPKPA